MPTLESWIARARQLWNGLKPGQRAVVAAVVAAGFVAAAYLGVSPSQLAYQPLYHDLQPDDLHEIQQTLGKDGIRFRQDDRTGAIEVPAEEVDKVRMLLAAEGLPRQGNGLGNVLEGRFGQTEFEQQIALQRGLEGELARSIRGLDSVEGVRVHLVLPRHEVFQSQASAASASVVLRLRAGRALSQSQVGGIVHLVSSAVAGLEPSSVTVIDQHGTMLTPRSGKGSEGELADGASTDARQAFESEIERRIEELLSPIVGAGHVVARVGVEFDTTRTETSEVHYDPDTTAIRSETRTEEKQAQGNGASGAASVSQNTPSGSAAAAPAGPGRASQQSTVNYEVSKVEKHSVAQPGSLRRVTAAVLVDGTYADAKDGKPGEYQPRTTEELGRIEALVRDAVSFSEKRGDSVHVENVRFQVPEVPPAAAGAARDWLALALQILRAAAPLLGIVLLYTAIVRPLMRAVPAPRLASGTTVAISPMAEAAAQVLAETNVSALTEGSRAHELIAATSRMRGDIAQAARQDPRRVAMLIQTLVQEE